jgi:urease accessory protein
MNGKLLAIALLAVPGLASAHAVGDGGGFSAGLGHPVLGFDHLLAMVSVGILSAQMGGRAMWSVPATFVSMMLFGGLLGIYGIPFFSVEYGIAVSVMALGIALAIEKKMPNVLAMVFVGFFALFHGHAHGTEMPVLAAPAAYSLGFVIGTACLHIVGVAIGLVSQRAPQSAQALRFVGASIAGIGFHLIVS